MKRVLLEQRMKRGRGKRRWATGLGGLGLLTALIVSAVAPAADRSDPAFGQGGVAEVLTPPGSEGFAVAIRDLARTPEGGLVAALGEREDFGYFGAARITRSGLLDPGFGTGGFSPGIYRARGARGGRLDVDIEAQAEAVAVQPDGKVLVAGYQQSPGSIRFRGTAPLLARYRPDGSLDRGFGSGGLVAPKPPFKPEIPGGLGPGGTVLHDVAIMPGGRIVAVGARNETHPQPAAVVIAYRPDGSIDRGFGSGGRVLFAPRRRQGVDYTGLFAAQVLAGGKVLVAGYRNDRLLLAKLRSNGGLDPSFGDGDGKVVLGIGTSGCCPGGASLAVQPDGRIVVQVNRFSRDAQRAVLLRFHPNGQLDRSFGNRGVVAPGPPSYLREAYDVALQPDGKIVAVGSAAVSRSREAPFVFAAVRYRPDGQLDRSFGRGGRQALARGAESIAFAAVLGARRRVVAAGGFATGSFEAGGEAGLLLTRYLP